MKIYKPEHTLPGTFTFEPLTLALLFRQLIGAMPPNEVLTSMVVYAAADVIKKVSVETSDAWKPFFNVASGEFPGEGLFGVLYDEQKFPMGTPVYFPIPEYPEIENGRFFILVTTEEGEYGMAVAAK